MNMIGRCAVEAGVEGYVFTESREREYIYFYVKRYSVFFALSNFQLRAIDTVTWLYNCL